MFTPLLEPRAALPVPSDETAHALVYDDYPHPSLARKFTDRTCAPGNQWCMPARIVMTLGPLESPDAVNGAIVAEGIVRGRMLLTPEGAYAEVLLNWPEVQTWGHARCEFLKQQARILCMSQYAELIARMQAAICSIVPHTTLLTTFVGEWDEASYGLRKKLTSKVLSAPA